ncbi:tripartite tricarboxylate transporter TctB family protein [Caldinitratiruptor microaerophilus]|uniref:DUF1468 domain-containing protein n=1 Tax=Caldinitratiruptor microaerophilus TaxID=671077 RepID=A0AA35CIC3_9FIRM|nr:tripartite tricarboxylate transporter TctB family protein [Caldinitratiruptor microaerophilus]BDG59552.1 hypothetical protein caldi_06420 [Caldinitratiruptor microaerophilus]
MPARGDRIVALIIAAVAILWWFPTRQLAVASADHSPGPGFFPRLVLIALLVLSGVLFVSTLRPPAADAECGDGALATQGQPPAARSRREPVTAALLLLGLLAYALSLERLGFLVATPVFLGGLFVWQLGWRNWLRAAVTALAVAVGVWAMFDLLLEAALPTWPSF